MKKTRTEKDSLGTKEIPENVYHGIFTERVLSNYQISRETIPYLFLHNYVRIKKIYASVNSVTGKLDTEKAKLIEKACDHLLNLPEQEFMTHFPIDTIQSGGGTSTNMMVNEVIANFANEIAGNKKGEYAPVHPNDHVNMSQSSNDTFPGVTKVTTVLQFEKLLKELSLTEKTFSAKAKKFAHIQKVGRTHLQDALRITAGEEFSTYAAILKKDYRYLKQIQQLCYELPFGGTALGNMQNVTPRIRTELIKKISKEFALPFIKPENFFEAISSSGDLEKTAAALSGLASDIIKISNDLRLLSSGPRAGLNEIILPAVQPGSSIMPGKVNPSILEALNMICFKVKGLHTTIDLATVHAQLQLQAFMPVIGFSLYEMLELLTNGLVMLREKCLEGLDVNKTEVKKHLDRSFVYATEYSEKLGYAKIAALVKKSLAENIDLTDLLNAEMKKNK